MKEPGILNGKEGVLPTGRACQPGKHTVAYLAQGMSSCQMVPCPAACIRNMCPISQHLLHEVLGGPEEKGDMRVQADPRRTPFPLEKLCLLGLKN